MQRRRLGFESKAVTFNREFENRGYVFIRKGGDYVKRSRAVMEEHIGRELTDGEVVHHINGRKNDDRIENLHLCNDGSKHNRIHHQAFLFIGELTEKGIVRFDKKEEKYLLNTNT
ncbi:HNH endonuclease [Geomicrobium sp. JCM 19037]|uniref:HNH endonuclease n=1 Tax=Geomicrobium sp. JCM 19037 TaxID=1460634 RepID=UPI0009DD0EA4